MSGEWKRRHVPGVVALLLSLFMCSVSVQAFSPWGVFGSGENADGVTVEAAPYRASSDGAASLRELLADYGKRVEWEIAGLENTLKGRGGRPAGRIDPFRERVNDRIQRLRKGLEVNVAVIGWMADELATFADRQLAEILQDDEDEVDSEMGDLATRHVDDEVADSSELRAVAGVSQYSSGRGNSGSEGAVYRFPECGIPASATHGEAGEGASSSTAQHSPQSQYGSLQDVLGHLARDFGDNLADGASTIQTVVYRKLGQLIVHHFFGSKASHHPRNLTVLVPGAATAGLLSPLVATLHELRERWRSTPGRADDSPFPLRTVELVLTECSRPLFAVLHCLLQACRWSEFPYEGVKEAAKTANPRQDSGLAESITLFPWLAGFQNLIRGDGSDQLMPVYLNATSFERLQSMLNDVKSQRREPLTGRPLPSQNLFLKTMLLKGDMFGVDWGRDRAAASATGAATVKPIPPLRFDVVLLSYVLDAVMIPSSPSVASEDGASFKVKGTKSSSVADLLDRIDQLVAPGGLLLHYGPLQYHHPAITGKLTMDEILLYFLSSSSREPSEGHDDGGADQLPEPSRWELVVYEQLGLRTERIETLGGEGEEEDEETRWRVHETDLRGSFLKHFFGSEGEENQAQAAANPDRDSTAAPLTCPLPYARPYRGSLFGNGHFPILFALRKTKRP